MLRTRFVALGLVVGVVSSGCGGGGSMTSSTRPGAGVTADSGVDADGDVTRNDIVGFIAETVAAPLVRFTVAEPQRMGPTEMTMRRVGEYDRGNDRAWVSMMADEVFDPSGALGLEDTAGVASLGLVDTDSAFSCVNDRDPLWLGGSRDEWEHLADSADVYADVDEGPLSLLRLFELLAAEPDRILNVESTGTVGGVSTYQVLVEAELIAPLVISARGRDQVRDADVDFGDPVPVEIEVDSSGFVISAYVQARDVFRSVLDYLVDGELPNDWTFGYGQILTLERISEVDFPTIDEAATSCPDVIDEVFGPLGRSQSSE